MTTLLRKMLAWLLRRPTIFVERDGTVTVDQDALCHSLRKRESACPMALEPCPFCGSADVEAYPADREHTRWNVCCGNPGCVTRGDNDYLTQSDAITAWNRRAHLAESRLAAANAQLRLMHRVLSQAVCVACADDGSAKDHELDKLEGVLRDQGWITSAVVPSTPTDEHLQGAGDEA